MKFWVLGLALAVLTSAGPSTDQISSTPITVGETLRIQSKRLGEERRLEIYLPPSYASSKQRYPVIYALDGEGTGAAAASAVQFMSGYSAIPQMPEALVVGVTNTNRNRDMPVPREYGEGGEENFLAFLAEELIPAIEQRYRTQPLRILVGHSQGGLFAIYALTARPALFQWILSMDAPLADFPQVKPLMDKAKAVITKSPNYHGRLVSIENLYGWRQQWASLIAAAPKGFYGEQVEIKDETHETMAYKGIYEGLKRLFHDYALATAKESKGIYTLPVLEERYKALSEVYGYRVDIPEPLLLASAAQNTGMRYGAEAVELVRRAVELYGESPTTKRLRTEAEEAVKKGRDPRLAEWANLPPADAARMKPFLGTWESATPDGARRILVLEAKDGAVVAQCTLVPSSGEPFPMEVQFVQVLDGPELQWGLRNGRGAGIILHTGKLVDENTLQGTIEPVGIQHAPPPHPFTYKRVGKGAAGMRRPCALRVGSFPNT